MKKVQISCFQHIPCNPCKFACPHGAIRMEHLTDLPEVDLDKCIGCGLCIPVCPGQACAVLDDDFTEKEAALSFPYEYLPVPVKGQKVQAVNNEGEIICEAQIEKVVTAPAFDHTNVVTISFDKRYAGNITGIRKI